MPLLAVETDMKSPRPDIPKLKILSIGIVTEDGKLEGNWKFDGSSNPKSVGQYITDDWYLIGGYTVDELRKISGS